MHSFSTAGIGTLVGWARAGRRAAARLAPPAIGALVFVPWAIYWGLFAV